MWKELLQRIWGSQKGYAFVTYGQKGVHPWKQRSYRYPEQIDILIKKVQDSESYTNVYFCPHLLLEPSHKRKDNAGMITALWLDKDSGPPEDIQPRPTICWSTSPGKQQALWLLKKPVEPERAEKVTKYLAYKIYGADKGCWNLGRVLRFPESRNYKYSPPEVGDLLWDDGPVYDISELEPKTKSELEAAFEKSKEMVVPYMPREVPRFTDALVEYGRRIPTKVWELLKTKPDVGKDWSENLWKMERLLLEAGVPPAYTFAIVKNSPWNKYKRDGRPDRDLWIEIHKASLEKGPYLESPEELPWVSIDELMLYSEKPTWLIEGIWMQKNVGWIAGVGKSYKTMLSIDLALSVASGAPFLDHFPVLETGPVLMVQEEDPVWRIAQRIQVVSQKKEISNLRLSHDHSSLVLELKESNIPLYVSIGGGLLFKDRNRLELLERSIEQYRPKLLVLDPMFMIAAGLDEFKSGEMAHALNTLKHWRNKYECAIAVVHHYRKGNGSSMERLYGSQALYAWSENNLFVSRTAQESEIEVELDIKDARRDDEKLRITFNDIEDEYDFQLEVDGQRVKKKSPPVLGPVIRDEAKKSPRKKGKAERPSRAFARIVGYLQSLPTEVDGVTLVDRKEVAEITGVDSKTLTARLKELEAGGYLRLVESDTVGRKLIVHIDNELIMGIELEGEEESTVDKYSFL